MEKALTISLYMGISVPKIAPFMLLWHRPSSFRPENIKNKNQPKTVVCGQILSYNIYWKILEHAAKCVATYGIRPTHQCTKKIWVVGVHRHGVLGSVG